MSSSELLHNLFVITGQSSIEKAQPTGLGSKVLIASKEKNREEGGSKDKVELRCGVMETIQPALGGPLQQIDKTVALTSVSSDSYK